MSITPSSLPSALQKTPYLVTFTATGGIPPYNWTSSAGGLPGGLALASVSGALAGTPLVCGTVDISVIMTDSATPPTVTQKTLPLTISCATSYDLRGNTVAPGASVSLLANNELLATTTSDGLGDYVIAGLSNGRYTVIPRKMHYAFTPYSQEITVANLDISGINFTAATDTTAPQTTITEKPAILTNTGTSVFSFISNKEHCTYECLIDGGFSASCDSPTGFQGLTPGLHTFQVRATDPAGNVDPSPDSWQWEIDLSAPDFTLIMAGDGGGTVNSVPSALTCSSGTCTKVIKKNTVFRLLATSDTGSLFAGWFGGVCSGSGDCPITLTSKITVTASFAAQPPIRLPGAPTVFYSLVSLAYDAANSGALIQAREVELAENLLFASDKAVILKGGYTTSFTTQPGMTTVKGTLTIRNGALVVDRVEIR